MDTPKQPTHFEHARGPKFDMTGLVVFELLPETNKVNTTGFANPSAAAPNWTRYALHPRQLLPHIRLLPESDGIFLVGFLSRSQKKTSAATPVAAPKAQASKSAPVSATAAAAPAAGNAAPGQQQKVCCCKKSKCLKL